MKIEDGNARAVPIAVVEALLQIDALSESDVGALAHPAHDRLAAGPEPAPGEADRVTQSRGCILGGRRSFSMSETGHSGRK